MSLVLDCSVTLSWYFEDEQTKASLAVLDEVVNDGAVVPSLWRFEVANGLQVAVRRRRIDQQYRDSTLADLALLEIRTDPDSDGQAWFSTLRSSERHGLTVYDAAYLELALRRGLRLATLYKALIKAGAAEMVTLFANQ